MVGSVPGIANVTWTGETCGTVEFLGGSVRVIYLRPQGGWIHPRSVGWRKSSWPLTAAGTLALCGAGVLISLAVVVAFSSTKGAERSSNGEDIHRVPGPRQAVDQVAGPRRAEGRRPARRGGEGRPRPEARGHTEKQAGQDHRLTDLFSAIAAVESNGDDTAVGDGGRSRGRYQISYAYWIDGGGPPAAYLRGVANPAACRRVMLAWWKRYEPDALAQMDTEVMARAHNGGPGWSKKPSTARYWAKVKAVMK